jgi:hypothetical protein
MHIADDGRRLTGDEHSRNAGADDGARMTG